MPILDLQRRMRQLGEIRIGHVVPTQNGKTRPEKLNRFRFTSPSEEILTTVAEMYGGKVKPWTPANGGPEEFEVYTQANRIPVVVPPLAVTQWYELYQGSKCVRRCDGQLEQKSDRACLCDPERRDCSLTTRLNVMLRDVPPIGHWLLTSRGYYAAIELPPIADLLAQGGGHVPGWLGVEERREIHEKPDGGTETRRFMVPTLDIDLSPARVLAGDVGKTTEQVTAQQAKAIEAGPNGDTAKASKDEQRLPTLDDIAKAETREQVANIWRYLNSHDALTPELEEACTQRVADIAGHKPPPEPEGEVDEEAVWQQIVSRAGDLGMTTEQLHDDFAASNGGVVASAASPGELQAYLAVLQERAA